MRLLRSYDQTKSIFSCFRFVFKIYTMERTLSVCSFTSDQLEGQEEDLPKLDFDVVPHDIFGALESVGASLCLSTSLKLD